MTYLNVQYENAILLYDVQGYKLRCHPRKACSTCKSVQDAFSAASKLLKYHSIAFSAFQCPPRSHNPHCSGNEPRIVMYHSPTRHSVYQHSTSSSRDMVNFINSIKDELQFVICSWCSTFFQSFVFWVFLLAMFLTMKLTLCPANQNLFDDPEAFQFWRWF